MAKVRLKQQQREYAMPYRSVDRVSAKAAKYDAQSKMFEGLGDLITGYYEKKEDDKKEKPEYADRLKSLYDSHFNSLPIGERTQKGAYTRGWKEFTKERAAELGHDVSDIKDDDWESASKWGLKRAKVPNTKSIIATHAKELVDSGDFPVEIKLDPKGNLVQGEGNYTNVANMYQEYFGVDLNKTYSPIEVRKLERVVTNEMMKTNLMRDLRNHGPEMYDKWEKYIQKSVKKTTKGRDGKTRVRGVITQKDANKLKQEANQAMLGNLKRERLIEEDVTRKQIKRAHNEYTNTLDPGQKLRDFEDTPNPVIRNLSSKIYREIYTKQAAQIRSGELSYFSAVKSLSQYRTDLGPLNRDARLVLQKARDHVVQSIYVNQQASTADGGAGRLMPAVAQSQYEVRLAQAMYRHASANTKGGLSSGDGDEAQNRNAVAKIFGGDLNNNFSSLAITFDAAGVGVDTAMKVMMGDKASAQALRKKLGALNPAQIGVDPSAFRDSLRLISSRAGYVAPTKSKEKSKGLLDSILGKISGGVKSARDWAGF